jgi:hypothetical protein
MSSTEHEQTTALLENLRDTLSYFAGAVDAELRELRSVSEPTGFDLLKARSFAFAYAGLNDVAIVSLNAVVSQAKGKVPRNLNKLAQLLTRRAAPGDSERAAELAAQALALTTEADTEERWFAHHNRAAAMLRLGRFAEATAAAGEATRIRDDRRTRAIAILAAQGSGGTGGFTDEERELVAFGLPLPLTDVEDGTSRSSEASIILANEMMKPRV